MFEEAEKRYGQFFECVKKGMIRSAYALDGQGLAKAVSKMAFGNGLGVRIDPSVTEEELEKLGAGPDDGFVKKLIGKYDPLNKAGSSEESRPERGGGEN